MSLVSFELGKQEYALPLERVREIIPLPDQVSEVARSETAVLGVVTLRDRCRWYRARARTAERS